MQKDLNFCSLYNRFHFIFMQRDLCKNIIFLTAFIRLILNIFIQFVKQITWMKEEGTNTRKELADWLKDDMPIDIFQLYVARNQAQLQKLCNSSLFTLKRDKTKAQFLKWAKQFFKKPQAGHLGEEQFHQGEGSVLKQRIIQFLETLPAEEKESKVQSGLNALFLEVQREKHARNMEAATESTIQKFTSTFNRVKEICQFDYQQDLVKLIREYGSMEALKMVNLKEDQQRVKLQKIVKFINLTDSYSELNKYAGQDLKRKKNQLQNDLENCLLKLQLPIKLIQQIKKQLLEKPLSNCMAEKKELSEEVRSKYFSSPFYKSKILLEYAQILSYPDTIHAKFMGEVAEIIRIISEQGKLNTDVLKMIFKFDLEGLMSHRNVSNVKRVVFNEVKQKFTNFYKGSQLVKHNKNTVDELKINQNYKKTFAMRDKFLEADLRFSQWAKVETQLFNRNDKFIHDLELNLSQKYILRKFYNEQMEPYFHKIQDDKRFSYEQQMRQILLNEIMQLKLQSSKDMGQIHSFIDLTIKLHVLQVGKIATGDLTENQKIELVAALKKNTKYQEYQKKKGKDAAQIEYQAKQRLKRLIYEVNLQNKIQVSSQSVQQLIDGFVANGLRVPSQSNQYVCNLEMLKKKFLAGGQDQSIAEMTQRQLNELKQEKNQIVSNFWTFLSQKCRGQSFIMAQKNANFVGSQEKYAEYLLQSNPFQNSKANLSKVGVSRAAAVRNIIDESSSLLQEHRKIEQFINQYQRVAKEIKELSGDGQKSLILLSPSRTNEQTNNQADLSNISPVRSHNSASSNRLSSLSPTVLRSKSDVQRELDGILDQFLAEIKEMDKIEQTYFTKNLMSRYQANPKDLVRKILEANPFANEAPEFYRQLKTENQLKATMVRNIQGEFKTIAGKFGKKLAAEYNKRLQELKGLE